MHEFCFSSRMVFLNFYRKILQFEQELKHLHYELRSKEVFLNKVKNNVSFFI